MRVCTNLDNEDLTCGSNVLTSQDKILNTHLDVLIEVVSVDSLVDADAWPRGKYDRIHMFLIASDKIIYG
jgi:hypothetical protein